MNVAQHKSCMHVPRGRPPSGREPMIQITARMTKEMRVMFLAVGGSKWLREQVEIAYREKQLGSRA